MSSSVQRLFAVIPAAGHSRRMGRPKLLLPLGGTTVIGRLLETLNAADVSATVVLVRPDDDDLREEVGRCGAIAVQPGDAPPEMRVSVEHLLRHIEDTYAPQPDEGWLLIPADHPLLRTSTLAELIAHWREHPDSIVLPTYAGRRGHPALLPWNRAAEVFALPADAGVNQLLKTNPEAVLEVPVDDPTVTLDLDTPADYERALTLLAE